MKCQKRMEVDQYVCDRCGFYWGRRDTDPPICLTDEELPTPVVARKPDRDQTYKTGAQNAREALRKDK